MHRKRSQNAQLWKKWGTHNPQQEYKWKIMQPMPLITKTWRRIVPRPSTYSSTECKTDAPSENSFFWIWGATNLGNCHNKHHSPAHHLIIRHKYLYTEKLINHLKVCFLWGCIISPMHTHSRAPGNSLERAISWCKHILARRRTLYRVHTAEI